jgi:hypothetical protein
MNALFKLEHLRLWMTFCDVYRGNAGYLTNKQYPITIYKYVYV